MLRTNSKKAIDNLKKWTVEHFDADGYNDFNGVVMAAYIESRKEIKTWNI